MKKITKKLIAPVIAGSLIISSSMCAFADTTNNNMTPPDGNSGNGAPQMPDGSNSNGASQMPDGSSNNGAPQMSDGSSNNGAPQMPDGSSNNGAPAKPDGESGNGGSGAPGGAPGGSSSGISSYDAVMSLTSDTTIDGESLSSTGTDENVIDVSENANVTVKNSTITRTSSDSTGGDNSSFYGVGAALLARSGNLYVSNANITTDSAGGAGVFAYKDGTAYVADSTITTTKDTSGGIHAAGGGKLYAWNLNVTTSGNSSAAIRSDRGGGTMVIDGGTYTSNGSGSPSLYCTADISVNNATLTANGSEALCIEGLNTTRLFNCNLTGNMPDNSQNDCTWNVILYQSMSGDSQEGNSTFEMVGGSLTAKNGGMFYTTNTESTFILSNVDITYASDSEFFLKCTGNSNQRGWGTSGKNGADCNFTGISQKMQGNVIWDSISQLDFYMTSGSTLEGAFVQDESNAGNGGSGYCNVYISSDSTWTVTGDSTITNLYNAGTIKDSDGKTVTIKGTDGTVYVNGSSSYTITVGSYSTSVDLSGASSVDSWSSYEVERPSQLGTATATSYTSSTSSQNSNSASGTSTNSTIAASSTSTGSSSVPTAAVVAASMGTVIVAAGAVYVIYKKKH